MAAMFNIDLAGISIGLEDRYGLLQTHCKDYLTQKPALFEIRVSDEEIEEEIKRKEPGAPDGMAYAELVCVYRAICKKLPAFDVFLFHSAAIECGGRAYLFSAPSGTGKSTHIRLWRENLKDRISIINGDKPLIRLEKDGSLTVHSSPWAGKEGWQRNCTYPLGGICFLKRAPENSILRLSPEEAGEKILSQILYPKDPVILLKALTLADKLASTAPVFELSCNISNEAARLSFENMTGEKF
jgi:hypothetical protein